MHKVIVLFLTFSVLVYGYNYDCDFSFGDPSWDFSQVYFFKNVTIPAGRTLLNFDLSAGSGQFVTFICVNIGVNKSDVNVAWAALFRRLAIKLNQPKNKDIPISVLAMRHGY